MTLVAEKKITIAEFLERDDFEEGYIYELINGEMLRRTSPNADHQRLSMRLSIFLGGYILQNQLGELFAAPFDVYLSEDADLVVPDLHFVAKHRLSIVQPTGYILGVPDIIVEILSKGTKQVDKGSKKERYEYFGVPEYWLIDPIAQSFEIYVLENGRYKLASFAEEIGVIKSTILTGFTLEVAKVFN
jgi:Uma2 family endonuclease